MRKLLSNVWAIHLFVALGLLALMGALYQDQNYLYLCVALSFAGAICGAFVRVLDEIRNRK